MDRYDTTTTKNDTRKKFRAYRPTIYPAIPIRDSDIFITTVVGERLENIAYQYYNDGSLWWIIAKANGLNDAVIANADKKIRIPTQIESILKKLEIESY
tara:strand:- start:211 stop:507 length:297 start_codon:yes stop_codon:yes gene_type:complete